MKFKTVREGQEAIIYNYLGEAKHVVGPKRVFLFRETLQYLQTYTASSDEYITLKDKRGILKHIPGPYHMFMNPQEHSEIRVKPAVKVDASQCIVVYKKKEDSSVERRIIDGPTVFVPEAEEWLHNFEWHDEDHEKPGRMIPQGQTFTHLASTPNQFYYKVREVRTTDDTMVTVKLMIFYQLEDIIKMLETTHDPIADMINAVCADVIAFAGKLTLEGFLQNTKMLNNLTTYTQLLERAQNIGYTINKVVYRGYHSSDQLQAMQDSAIQKRTQMRLQVEMDKQKRKLMDFRLTREQKRAQMLQDMEKNKLEHDQKIGKMKQDFDLYTKQTKHEASLEEEAVKQQAELGIQEARDKWESERLTRMKNDLDLDLTSILISQQPPQIDEEVIVAPSNTKNADPWPVNADPWPVTKATSI